MKRSELISEDQLTRLLRIKGCNTWNEVVDYVRNLPYGRNASRTDLSQVLTNERGTCSSKHALLKEVADRNKITEVELILAIYRMTVDNTPGIGDYISAAGLEYLPEAHCYLKVDGKRIDCTSESSDIQRLESAIIQELVIQPEQVGQYKVNYHKTFIKQWLAENDIRQTPEEIWKIREKCIAELSR